MKACQRESSLQPGSGKAAAGGGHLHQAEWVGTGAVADSQVRSWLSWCQLASRGQGGSPVTESQVMAQI